MSPAKAERPAPLVPREVNLSALEYMPLYIARLNGSKSWMACRRKPELAYYLVNLWKRAWHERPAGSLEADDDVLCDAAGCVSFEQWVDLKADLLKGWILCSDGRYYHVTLCEFVMEAWGRRQAYVERTAAARAARKRSSGNVTNNVTSHVAGNVTKSVTDRVTSSNDGKKERKKEISPPNGGASAPGINGAPRHAYLDTLTARRIRDFGKVRDPISAQIIDEWGGVGAVQALSDDEWFARQAEFETRYAELSAKAPH